MSWTQIDPSPTAEATLFTLAERTSPTANTPGRLVSTGNVTVARRRGWSREPSTNIKGAVSEASWSDFVCAGPDDTPNTLNAYSLP